MNFSNTIFSVTTSILRQSQRNKDHRIKPFHPPGFKLRDGFNCTIGGTESYYVYGYTYICICIYRYKQSALLEYSAVWIRDMNSKIY